MSSQIKGDAAERKAQPIFSGVLRYFPKALAEVAKVSKAGNDQHNPGQPLHWAKEKSRDELDALARHLADAGTRDSDGQRHSAKVAWRALANLEREIEMEEGYGYDPVLDQWRKLDEPVRVTPIPGSAVPHSPHSNPCAGDPVRSDIHTKDRRSHQCIVGCQHWSHALAWFGRGII